MQGLREARSRLVRQSMLLQKNPRALWYAFIGLHAAVFVALTPLMLRGDVEGDLPLYRSWASHALSGGVWPVFDFSWVYPAGALLPIVLSNVLGESLYMLVWLVLLTGANAVGLWLLTDRGRKTVDNGAAWWWLLIVFLLSPVGMLRLEGFSAPLVIAALMTLATRPRAAGVLLAVATWIKVWPAAVIAAVVVASNRRMTVLRTGVVVTVGVVAVVGLAGGLSNLSSFITMQSSRGLQLEAPLSTPWLWMAMLRVPGASIYQNVALATREVMGPGDGWAINSSTEFMFGVIIALVAILAVATFGIPGARPTARPVVRDEFQLVLVGALALTTAFVVFNKVGSPQYMLWIAPIVAVGLLVRPRTFHVPAVLMGWIAGLTTLVFPILYLALIDLNPIAVLTLAARNVLVIVLFGWAAVRLVEYAFEAVGLEGWTLRRAVARLAPDRELALRAVDRQH